MKIQSVNTGVGVNTKGGMPKPGKLANLAYSAIFAASLAGAADCFIKQDTNEQQPPKTEIVAGLQSDEEFEEALLEVLQERKRQREANDDLQKYIPNDGESYVESYKNYLNNKAYEEEQNQKSARSYIMAILSGIFIGGIARWLTNEIKYG